MIEKIKQYYRKSCLKNVQAASNRFVKCTSLSKARYIGILYQIEEEASYILLSSYVDSLLAEGKVLRIVGYHNHKYVPHYCIPKLKYDFFCQKEQNWFGKPNAAFVEEFVNEPFDLLLDLSLNSLFPLQYLLAKSKATFKVGRQKENNTKLLDMMLKLDDDKSVKDLMAYINEYTNILNGE